MSFQQIELTTALRPSLLPGETLLFVQDAVGLYDGCVLLSPNPYSSQEPHQLCKQVSDQMAVISSYRILYAILTHLIHQKIQDPKLSEWTSLPHVA